MNINHKILINDYRNYLIMLKVNTTKVNMSIKSIDDIKIYEEECKLNLNKLETLSKDHKLYEKDYDDFRVSMGKFAIGLSKFHKLKISDKEKLRLTKVFLDLNESFEDLMQRNIIKDAGYGEYFTHRTGHSIGIEVHDFGDVSAVNHEEVKAGMIFSVEPGIYLKDNIGVRIEDLVLVTKDGCEVLNSVTKEIVVL